MKITKAQRKALYNVYTRHFYPHNSEPTYRQFRRTVEKACYDDCIMVPIPTADRQAIYMWLGIETDGYTHS